MPVRRTLRLDTMGKTLDFVDLFPFTTEGKRLSAYSRRHLIFLIGYGFIVLSTLAANAELLGLHKIS
jgi:hypothetical protein